jgi:hypothetical protein
MTTEQNEPQAAAEQRSSEVAGVVTQVQIPGAGQGRRRRRRRRNKGAKPQLNGQAPQPAANGQAPEVSAQAAPEPSAPRPQQQPRQKSQGRQFKGNGGQNANPGNGHGPNGHYTNNGNGGQKQQAGGRRKGKQPRRQQVFVGPMDHSYRTANGNVADSSHQQQNHNYEFRGMPHSGFYGEQDVFSMPAVAAPVREDAPVRIYFFIEDLFFVAKIQEAARKMGIKVEFAKSEKDTLARITGADEETRASLIVFDLNNVNAKPLTLIPKLKAKLKRGTSIIGFLSHLQGDLKAKAIEAGCDMVMPRSAFSQNLPNLLRRHGLDEEFEALEA